MISIVGGVGMRRGLAVALFLAACTGVALAAGYDDFSRGVNANNRGDADAAISAFTAALAAGDLAPGYVPNAHFGRARAYLQKDKCAEALSDLDEVIKLKADNVDAYLLRGAANACLKKPDAALADFNAAIGLRPSATLYEALARFQWNYGFFPQAAENYAQAVKLAVKDNPRRPHLVLWYAMSADRAGTLDQVKFAAEMSKLDIDDWPAPLLDLYRGKTTADKVYREAASRDAQAATNQKCEADFYIGEWQLARKNEAAAKPLLQQAVSECPHNFVEYFAAQVELKRLP
jgi:lipoprotein NlpI